MIKYLGLLFLFSTMLFAQKVEISADHFEADERAMRSILQGNVTLKKGNDIVHTDKLIVFFDKDNKPKKYLAQGNINFTIYSNKQQFQGDANKLIYNPLSQKYILSGNAFIHELTQDRKLYGETIILDRRSGKSTIKGSKHKPVKLIFEVEE